MYYKYPRTPHIPSSPGATADDISLFNMENLLHKAVVITEKMDGENTSMYSDYIHARSVDSRNHPSRAWVRALHARIKHLIPCGWRICGENLWAQHSLAYSQLPSYFLVFSIWNEDNICLSWEETEEWLQLLELDSVPVLYKGILEEDSIPSVDTEKQEGYVIRLAESFSYQDFQKSIAKWVRKGHVRPQTTHWMSSKIIPNKLKICK